MANNHQRALVQNAADPAQVKNAERFEKRRRERFAIALSRVLETHEGRTILHGIIYEMGGLDKSIWTASAEIHYNAGWQDFARAIAQDIRSINEDAYQQMMREAWDYEKQQQASIAAAHEANNRTKQEREHVN